MDWHAQEKQVSRDRDAARLARGEITPAALAVENDFFRGIDVRRGNFKIVSIGGRPFGGRRAGG